MVFVAPDFNIHIVYYGSMVLFELFRFRISLTLLQENFVL